MNIANPISSALCSRYSNLMIGQFPLWERGSLDSHKSHLKTLYPLFRASLIAFGYKPNQPVPNASKLRSDQHRGLSAPCHLHIPIVVALLCSRILTRTMQVVHACTGHEFCSIFLAFNPLKNSENITAAESETYAASCVFLCLVQQQHLSSSFLGSVASPLSLSFPVLQTAECKILLPVPQISHFRVVLSLSSTRMCFI